MVTIAAAHRPMAVYDYADDGKYIKVTIRQHGDKFSATEKNADEWLSHISREALEGRYDASWVAQFKLEYDAFLKGNELPRDGTPIRTWGAISREQGTRLIGMSITTIEDLAACPDSGLGDLGLDGRYLRDLAKNFLDSGKGTNAMAKKLADFEQLNRDQADTIKALSDRLTALEKDKPMGLPKKAA